MGNRPPYRSGTENQVLWNLNTNVHHNRDPTKEIGKTGNQPSRPPLNSQDTQPLLTIKDWVPTYPQPPRQGVFTPNLRTEFYTSPTKAVHPTVH